MKKMLQQYSEKSRWVVRALAAMAATAMLLTASGCSDSGATGDSTTTSTSTSATGPTTGGSIAVLLSPTSTLASASGSTITLTAVVKNSGNAGVAGQTVLFSTTDAGVTIVNPEAVTNATGTATGTMTIGAGPTSNSNRTIAVVATSSGLTVTQNVQVVGSTVTVTGPDAVALSTAAQYVVTVRDSASNALASQAVTVTSQAGNPITSSPGTTDAQGQFKFSVTPSKAGSDTLTIAAAGVSAVKSFSVSGDQLSFVGSPAEVEVNSVQTLTLNLLKNGVAFANQPVDVRATRGTLSTNSVTTDSAGRATVTITSPTAGFTEVNASSASGLNATSRIEFVSSNPSKINLQASPSTVATNVSGSSSNSSQLIATVRDAADNPVKNSRVNFSFVADPSNGRIEPGFATTDSNGTASTVFIAGPNSSGNNAVVIAASLPGVPAVAASQASLTVSRSVLVVRIGTGNEVEKIDTTKMGRPYTVIVSDSSGNPVKDVLIQASLVPLLYFKGFYIWNGVDQWVKSVNYQCANEDTNGNGQLDPAQGATLGEDDPANGIGNGDTFLTPGNPAVVAFNAGFETGKTNSLGYLDMRVIYPREYATWLQVRLRVTAVVAGTEGVGIATFTLPGVAGDYTSATVAPPGVFSPYGQASACTNPN
jgi:Bacterial Ig-like domain (group 1)